MSRDARFLGFSIAAILAATAVGTAKAVTIATVLVGYAGNSPDPMTGIGVVPYNYRIATYDVTNAQYVEFLNAKASAADPYALWNLNMAGIYEGAIFRSGTGPYSYSVKPGYANKPVVYVSWYDAIRFVNWLQNGEGNGDTESGAYSIIGGGSNSGTVVVPDETQRATWAAMNPFHWLLPSENEWYKAAYYNGSNGTYYTFPFQSNSEPALLAPPGTTNSDDFTDSFGYTPAYNYDGHSSHLTDVGAYPNSLSPFGAFDMGGDVNQWNDTAQGPSRGVGGGFWGSSPFSSASYALGVNDPTWEGYAFGFRVASVGGVPEPSTGLLAALACGVIWFARRSVLCNDADR
jgi:formylglycine-generating enzyme required for sulfatase activity